MSEVIQAASPDGQSSGGGAPAVQPHAPATVTLPSDALAARLSEERSKGAREAEAAVLARLGVTKADDAVALLNVAKTLQQSSLSEAEKSAARIKELEPAAAQLPIVQARLKAMAEREFASLPPTFQAAIDAQAAGDPMRRLDLIDVFKTAGVIASATTANQTQPTTAAPLTSAPPGNAPPPAGVRTKFSEYEELRADPTKQLFASIFYTANMAEIERTRPKAQ